MENKIASAPTIDRLQKLARKYFYSDVVIKDGLVFNTSQTGTIKNFSVVQKRKRFYLVHNEK